MWKRQETKRYSRKDLWQEGKEGEEGLMSATVKQRKTRLVNVAWRSEKGHLSPEVKTANEITCDFVWNKLYPALPAFL
jgi:hypothetical protein